MASRFRGRPRERRDGRLGRAPLSADGRHRPRALLALAAAGAIVLLSCAYSFSGSSVPAHIKTVAVPTFANRTLQPGLERELTDAVIQVFLDDNRLKIGGLGSADAVVEGQILGYDHSVFGIGDVDQAQEYRVTIRAAITVKDRVKGKDLWSKDPMVTQSTYRLDATGENLSTESQARADAVRKLAEDVLSSTLEEW